MADPKEHYFIIHANADGFLHADLARWLMSLGVTPSQWGLWLAKDRNNDCNYNAALYWLLHSQAVFDRFVICDCDIRPHESKMREFWASAADIVGVRYPTEREDAFDVPDVIHTGLWRTTRDALQAIEDEFGTWFEWGKNDNNTGTTACLCKSLVHKARKLGLSIEQGGYAMHVPRQRR